MQDKAAVNKNNLIGVKPGQQEPVYFLERIVAGDGQCGLTVLGITRYELIEVLKPLAQSSQCREELAEDIKEFLLSDGLRRGAGPFDEQIINRHYEMADLFQMSVSAAFKNLPEELQNVERDSRGVVEFDSQLRLVLANAPKDQVNHILAQQEEEQQAIAAFADYCRNPKVFEKYIDAYGTTGLYLSRACILMFARQQAFSVYIWRPESSASSNLQLLGFHQEAKGLREVHMIWRNLNHFNELVPVSVPKNDTKPETEPKPEGPLEPVAAFEPQVSVHAELPNEKLLSKKEALAALTSFFSDELLKLDEYPRDAIPDAVIESFNRRLSSLLLPANTNYNKAAAMRLFYRSKVTKLNELKLKEYQTDLTIKAMGALKDNFILSYGEYINLENKKTKKAIKNVWYSNQLKAVINEDIVQDYEIALYSDLPKNDKGERDMGKAEEGKIYIADNGVYHLINKSKDHISGEFIPRAQVPFLRLSRYLHNAKEKEELLSAVIRNNHISRKSVMQTAMFCKTMPNDILGKGFHGPIPLKNEGEIDYYQIFKEERSGQAVLLHEDKGRPFTGHTSLYCPSEPNISSPNRLREGRHKVIPRAEIFDKIFHYLNSNPETEKSKGCKKLLGESAFKYLCGLQYQKFSGDSELEDNLKVVVSELFGENDVILLYIRIFSVFTGLLDDQIGPMLRSLKQLGDDKVMLKMLDKYAAHDPFFKKEGINVINHLIADINDNKNVEMLLSNIVQYFVGEAAYLCSEDSVYTNFLKKIENLPDDEWLDKIILEVYQTANKLFLEYPVLEVEAACWYEQGEMITKDFFTKRPEVYNQNSVCLESALISYAQAENVNLKEYVCLDMRNSPGITEFGRVGRVNLDLQSLQSDAENKQPLCVVERSGKLYNLLPKENKLNEFCELFATQCFHEAQAEFLADLSVAESERIPDMNYYDLLCKKFVFLSDKLTRRKETYASEIEHVKKTLRLLKDDLGCVIAEDKSLQDRQSAWDRLDSKECAVIANAIVNSLPSEHPYKSNYQTIVPNTDSQSLLVSSGSVTRLPDDVILRFIEELHGFGFTIDCILSKNSETLFLQVLTKKMPLQIFNHCLLLQPNPFIKDANNNSPIKCLRIDSVMGKQNEVCVQKHEEDLAIQKFLLLLKNLLKKLSTVLDNDKKLLENLEKIQSLDDHSLNYIECLESSYLDKHIKDLKKPKRQAYSCVEDRGKLLVMGLEILWDRLIEREYEIMISDLQKEAMASQRGFFGFKGSQLLSLTQGFINSGAKVVKTREYVVERDNLTHRKGEWVATVKLAVLEEDYFKHRSRSDDSAQAMIAELQKKDVAKTEIIKSQGAKLEIQDEKIGSLEEKNDRSDEVIKKQGEKISELTQNLNDMNAEFASLKSLMMRFMGNQSPPYVNINTTHQNNNNAPATLAESLGVRSPSLSPRAHALEFFAATNVEDIESRQGEGREKKEQEQSKVSKEAVDSVKTFG